MAYTDKDIIRLTAIKDEATLALHICLAQVPTLGAAAFTAPGAISAAFDAAHMFVTESHRRMDEAIATTSVSEVV